MLVDIISFDNLSPPFLSGIEQWTCLPTYSRCSTEGGSQDESIRGLEWHPLHLLGFFLHRRVFLVSSGGAIGPLSPFYLPDSSPTYFHFLFSSSQPFA
jgi:hypothetical protein